MTRPISIPLLAGLLLLMAAHTAPAQSDGEIISLDPALRSHVNEALENHPGRAAWDARVEAARERISRSGAWADPMLGVSAMNLPANSFALDQEPMTGLWVNLSQQVPLTGRFGSAASAARAGARQDSARAGAWRNGLAADVAAAWYNWAFLRAAAATLDTSRTILEDLLVLARTRYETGEGMQQDLLRLQTERTKLQERHAELAQQARSAGRTLARLMGRDPNSLPAPPDSLPVALAPLDTASLRGVLLERSPELAAARSEVARQRAEHRRAEQSWWPDLTVSAGYGIRQNAPSGASRPDFVTLSASAPIPIFGAAKQGAAVQEAEAHLRSARSGLRDRELDLLLALENLVDEEQRHHRQITLYTEGIIPQAFATLQTSSASWSAGKADAEAVLMAEDALINARLGRLMHLRERASVRARLAALMGMFDTLSKNNSNE